MFGNHLRDHTIHGTQWNNRPSLANRTVLFILLSTCPFIACHRSLPAEPTTTAIQPYAWTTSTPQAQNVDTDSLSFASQDFRSAGYVESFLVVRNGYLIEEQYYTPDERLLNADIASITKSFISALVGIAIQQGYLDSLGETMIGFFPEDNTPSLDSLKRLITIEHLVSMRSGFQYDESKDYSDIFNQSTDWMKEAIGLPMASIPGRTFNYASVNAHLVSGILTRASHLSTSNLAKTYLFKPLGINVLSWPQDPQGYYFGAGRMVFYPRDLARFGYLYENGGSVDGHMIIPASWVSLSTQAHVLQIDAWGDFTNVGYGYYWWTAQWNSASVFLAVGFGGQFILCLPSRNLVVVITSNQNCTTAQANQRHLDILNIVSKRVLSAVR